MAQKIMQMIREFSGQTTQERKAFHSKIIAALQDAGIQDYPIKKSTGKYVNYFNQLHKFLSTRSAQETHDQDEEEEEGLSDIVLLPQDDEVASRQSERILDMFPSLTLIDEKWIDIENIFSLDLEFVVQIESLKKRLRRQIRNTRKTVGFRIINKTNDLFNRKEYSVHKHSVFTLFSSWNILSFQCAMRLESKLSLNSNQQIENILGDLKECVYFTRTLVQESPIQNEQQEVQKRMFQLFNQFDEFLFSSTEKKSSFDISTILLDIRKNNNSLAGICQAILNKLNNSQPPTTTAAPPPGPNQMEKTFAIVLQQEGTKLVNELTSTLEYQLQEIEQNILKEMRFKIIDQIQKDQSKILNLQYEQNTQLMKLYQSVTNYQSSVLIAVQSAHSQIKNDIKKDISTGNILLLQAIEKIQEEYSRLSNDCHKIFTEQNSTNMIVFTEENSTKMIVDS
jgi:hypothetical protein